MTKYLKYIFYYLFTCLSLSNPLSSNLDLWLTESFHELISIDTHKVCNLVGKSHVIRFSLIIAALLLELDFSTAHNASSELVAIPLFFIGESNDIKGIVSELQLFIVINGGNSDLSTRDKKIIVI